MCGDGEVSVDQCKGKHLCYYIAAVGYGEKHGTPYWIFKNICEWIHASQCLLRATDLTGFVARVDL
jgi:hypothetical protein